MSNRMSSRWFFAVGFALFLTACGAEQQAAAPEPKPSPDAETARLTEYLDARFEEQLQRSPMMLTILGRKEHYGELGDFSVAADEAEIAWYGETVNHLQQNFDRDALTPDGKVSYDIWLSSFDDMKKWHQYWKQQFAFHQMDGLHADLPTFLIGQHVVDDASDAEAYISRLNAIPAALDQMLARAGASAGIGVVAPIFTLEQVRDASSNVITGAPFQADAEPSPLLADITEKVNALKADGKIDANTAGDLINRATRALVEQVGPAYERVIDWHQAQLDANASSPLGAGNLPDGTAYYDAVLSLHTTTDLTAEQIHQIGLDEVARISGEMEKLAKSVGHEGDLQSFFDYVTSAPELTYQNTDEARQSYLDDVNGYFDAMYKLLPDYFGVLPKAPLEVKRVEAYRERDGGSAHYFASSPDGSRPGVFYSHMSDMAATPRFRNEALAYHEGIPGHHLQIAIQQELTGVPEFRKQAGFTAYVEGWALYAEQLAAEMGAYHDPYQRFGQYTSEMYRAVRLVVDTGLHTKNWTEDQAVEYFLRYVPFPETKLRSEVERYLVMPGQATSYKMGMIEILQLREKAKAELGDHFDIRGFHDMVLQSGAVPLSILARITDQWITDQKAKK